MKQEQISLQETEIELALLGQDSLTQPDLMTAIRQISALAALYRGVVRDPCSCLSIKM